MLNNFQANTRAMGKVAQAPGPIIDWQKFKLNQPCCLLSAYQQFFSSVFVGVDEQKSKLGFLIYFARFVSSFFERSPKEPL